MAHLPNFMNEETEVQASCQGVEINNETSNRSLENPKRTDSNKGQTYFHFLFFNSSLFLDKDTYSL